jgi:hypothetical protein
MSSWIFHDSGVSGAKPSGEREAYLNGHLDCERSCDDPERDKWYVGPEHNGPHRFLQENPPISHQIRVHTWFFFESSKDLHVQWVTDPCIRTCLNDPRPLTTLEGKPKPRSDG